MALRRQELLKGETNGEYQRVRLVSIEQPAEICDDQRIPLPPVEHAIPRSSRRTDSCYVQSSLFPNMPHLMRSVRYLAIVDRDDEQILFGLYHSANSRTLTAGEFRPSESHAVISEWNVCRLW